MPQPLGDPRTQRYDAIRDQLEDSLQVHRRRIDEIAHGALSLHGRRCNLHPIGQVAPGYPFVGRERWWSPSERLSQPAERTWEDELMTTLALPTDLLPADGRFGSGPSRIRPAQSAALAAVGSTLMGTSHRQAPVKQLVARVRAGLRELLGRSEERRVGKEGGAGWARGRAQAEGETG